MGMEWPKDYARKTLCSPCRIYLKKTALAEQENVVKVTHAMKNDVEKYIQRRKRKDKAFAKDFEAGYALTVRTLKANKAGKREKRFSNKKELYADLGL